ncbi:MAG: hypothetical protein HY852_12220 [Bradyrhizobium sp.]|uniref:hypothetical protein n=1 Tax=Bradyrhizobium sp. TaxID=376 RepID=UPI0025C24E42|nr:hypothetical protein [Bradyrhizobium sp.]MBI5262569.1 hypothetical protein [Bradyrhizobium sp.]
MSDFDVYNKESKERSSQSSSKGQTGESSRPFQGQMSEAEARQRAGEAFQASSDAASGRFKEAAEAVRDVASDAAGKVQEKAREQQHAGADFVERVAGNIRSAAQAFQSDAPFAARGINSAADYVEDAAEKIRNGTFRDLVDGATDFAKRQPVAFLGLSVLAGFAAVRFLKASGDTSGARDDRS